MKMSIRTLRARKNSAFQIDCLGGISLTTLTSECLKWGRNSAPHIRFCMWTINVKHCSTVNIHCRVERLNYIEACCILCLNWRKNINQSCSNHTITDWANRKTVSTKCSYRCTVRSRISLGFLSLFLQMTYKEIPVSTVTTLLAKCSLYLYQISASKRGYCRFYFYRTYISIGFTNPNNIHSPQVGTGLRDAALTAVNGNLICIIVPM